MKNLFKVLKVAVFVFSILFIFNILKNDFNSNELKSLIFKADYKLLFASTIVSAILMIIKSFRLQSLAKAFEIPISLLESTKIQLISITFSIMTPGRVGEFTKIFLLAKDKKELIPAGTVICLFERLTDILVLVMMSLVLCLFTLNDPKILLLLILSMIGLISSFLLLFKMEFILNKFSKLIPEKIAKLLNYFVIYKTQMGSKALAIFTYSFVVWSVDGFFQWLILNSVGAEYNLITVIGINAIVSIMSILTILPLGLGTMDFSALFLYEKILAIGHEKIVFLLVTARFFSIGVMLLMLLPIMIFQKEFLEKLFKDMTNKKKVIT